MVDDAPPTRKQLQSQATQSRLLAAAFEEFQRHGLAGARVDRIAAAAKANKRLIYVYFGDKEQLFDEVVLRNVETMLDTVPFEARDLPGYGLKLFEYFEQRPGLPRLFLWRNLERMESSGAEMAFYRRKVAEITAAQEGGVIDTKMAATHLLAYVLGLVGAWAMASPALQQTAGADPRREDRAKTLHDAVARLIHSS